VDNNNHVSRLYGFVMGVKDSTYQTKDGKQVPQFTIDLYCRGFDPNPVRCQIVGAGVMPPPVESKVEAEICGIRSLNFGPGYVVMLKSIRVIGDGLDHQPSVAASQPPSTRLPK